MQGTDLSRWLTHRQGSRPSTVSAYGSLGAPEEWRIIVRGNQKLAVDHTFKPTHLYNLEKDPFELENLAALPAAARLRGELLAALRRSQISIDVR
jgi:arylsulfatase A-like enzyme